MAKRKTIGVNPLDCYIQPAEVTEVKELKKERTAVAPKLKQSKERITVQISSDVIERIKNAVYWTPGMTLAGFAEQAFLKAVDRLEKEKPFPQRHQELRTGRPLK